LGNLIIIIWISLGAIACGLFNYLAAIGFFLLTAFLIFFELGKHGCVTCYYCKNCTIGMGKLPYLFFRRGGTANVNLKALKLFQFVHFLISLLPILLVTFSLFQQYEVYKTALLLVLLLFGFYSGIVRRKLLKFDLKEKAEFLGFEFKGG